MRKPYFNLIVVVALLFGLLATVPTKVALADCSPDNGTDILCTGTDTNGVVTGGVGSNSNPDVVVVEAGATVDTTTGGCDAIDSAGALSVFNDGAITAGCDGIDVADDLIDLTNTGSIDAFNEGVWITDDIEGTFYNSGTIISDNSYGVYVGDDINGSLYNSGDINGGGNDGIGVSGDAALIYNDTTGTIAGYDDGINVGGDAEIYNDGLVFGFSSDAIDINGAGLVTNDVNGVIDGLNNGLNIDGDGLVVNSGEILAYNGDGIDIGGYAIIYNDGFIWGDDEGIDTAGGYATYIYSSGTIIGNSTAIDTSFYDDVVVLDSGSLTVGGDDNALELYSGNDTVILGAGGVSYGTSCGDINVTNVDNNAATVIGLMDGADDTDTLVFSILTPNQGAVTDLDAYLASLGGTNTAVVNGQTYDYANFEYYGINATVYTEGTTRLFDDGVVLAFATSGGIAVCNGPKGLRAGTINFFDLDNGTRDFSANGLSVHVEDLGGGKFKAHLFDGGKEIFNDANGNGAADSAFVFSR